LVKFPSCELHREMHSGYSSASGGYFVDGQNGKRCSAIRQRHHESALMFGSQHCEDGGANSGSVVVVNVKRLR